MVKESYVHNLLEDYFKKYGFVNHQIDSFNHYIQHDIQRIISEESDIVIQKNADQKYIIHFGEVYITNPTIMEENRIVQTLYPNKARNEDLYYETGIHVDIMETLEEHGKIIERNIHKRVLIAKTPVMLRSSICNLTYCTPAERIEKGECEYDQGGYFIIKGKERVLIAQVHGVYNQVLVFSQKPTDKNKYVAEIRSMSEETGHSVLVQVKITVDEKHIMLCLPYIKEPIPVGVIFKALGYLDEDSFRKIIGIEGAIVEKYLKNIIRSSFFIKTQEEALKFIGQYSLHIIKEDKRKDYAWQVVETELFPHLGITATIKDKVYFLGYMVKKLLLTHIGYRTEDDRDNYKNKRVEMSGILCAELFRTLFKRYTKNIQLQLDKKKFNPDVMSVISRNNTITTGFRTAAGTGNWGIQKNAYIRTGVSQVVSRLTFGATLSHLRRLALPVGKEGKNSKIRQINPSQIMFICPMESPEGAGAGIVLNLALLTQITHRIPTIIVKEIIERSENIVLLNDYDGPNTQTRVFLNGILIGFALDPDMLINELRLIRKQGLLDKSISITYDEIDDDIKIFADEGRLIRPLFSLTDGNFNIKETDGTDWEELVNKNLIEYLDNCEVESYVLAMSSSDLSKFQADYCEIHPSMMLGVMASIVPFSANTQSPRVIYQCLDPDELVLMADLSKKRIKDIIIGDSIISVDPITCCQTITKVVDHFVKETDKQLMTITTETGRKLTCTTDHLILTSDGWQTAFDAIDVCVIPLEQVFIFDEYYKYCQQKNIQKINSWIKCYHEDLFSIRSSQLGDCPSFIEFYNDLAPIYHFNQQDFLNKQSKWMRRQEFRICSNHTNNLRVAIFINIEHKELKPEKHLIADLTTESSNHSFIAGDSFVVHNSSMGKQALGIHALSHNIRSDTISYVMDYPQKPLVSTAPSRFMGFNDMPSGVNAIVAIACYTGFNN